MKKPKAKRPLPEGEPVVTHLSNTEWVTTYPDGTVVQSHQNRPDTEGDIQWMFGMVHELANVAKESRMKDDNGLAA
jgi:hypothetical protein